MLISSHSALCTEMHEGGQLRVEPPKHCKHLVNSPHYSLIELIFTFHSFTERGKKKHLWNSKSRMGHWYFLLANAICYIPYRNVCVLTPSLTGWGRKRGSISGRPSDINQVMCDLNFLSPCGLRLSAVCFLYKHGFSLCLSLSYALPSFPCAIVFVILFHPLG